MKNEGDDGVEHNAGDTLMQWSLTDLARLFFSE
jgi:hypothetical protein